MLALQREIQRYCAQHRNAADTVEGVRRWWISDSSCPLDDVEQALEGLVQTGVLARRTLPDGNVIYFLRAD